MIAFTKLNLMMVLESYEVYELFLFIEEFECVYGNNEVENTWKFCDF